MNKITLKIINSEAGKSNLKTQNLNLNIDNHLLTDPLVISNIFNDYFADLVDTNVIPSLILPTNRRDNVSEINYCLDVSLLKRKMSPTLSITYKIHSVLGMMRYLW